MINNIKIYYNIKKKDEHIKVVYCFCLNNTINCSVLKKP